MQRALRLLLLWNWLPHFRAVAEVGSIRRAAASLRMSPSALSRSVTLLEHQIGHPLFARTASRLELTTQGEALLEATRAAMRQLDDALDPWFDAEAGPVTVCAREPWLSRWVVPTLSELGELGPHLTLRSLAPDDVGKALVRGVVDVAFVVGEANDTPRSLLRQPMGSMAFGEFVSAEVQTEVPSARYPGQPRFEAARGRRVLPCASFEATLEACRRGAVTAWLPLDVAMSYAPELVRTPAASNDIDCFLLRRKPLGRASALSAWIDRFAQAMADRLSPGRAAATR